MKLEEFNQKYRSGKKDNVYEACEEAMLIMQNSLDDIHNLKHVENILTLIDLFISKRSNLQVDFDVLTLAICWHDTWIALKGTGGVVKMSYQRLAEGIASSFLFKKGVKKYSLNTQLIKDVSYVIRKHSTIQLIPKKTVEAKLLDDADKTDARNFERIRHTQVDKRYLSKKLHLKITLFYLNRIDQRINFAEHYPIYYAYKRSFVSYLENKL